ncbi:MAG: GAF domain-containing protein [Treponema sp.]|nr:GAF domain-containing protein [Treponema sp.]
MNIKENSVLDIPKDDDKLKRVIEIERELGEIQDVDVLLERILTETRRIVNADAGSIYVVEGNSLRIKYGQNDTHLKELPAGAKLPYTFFSFPINQQQICGYVALTGEPLNIKDCYKIPESKPYKFNKVTDLTTEYRTKSMYTIPLKMANGKLLGILQIINAKDEKNNIIPFDEDAELLISHFASSTVQALQHAYLTSDMVRRMLKMAEFRDPKETYPHVERVSSYSLEIYDRWAFNHNVPVSESHTFRDTLKIAAKFHDVGKVGISDVILKKTFPRFTEEERNIMKGHTCIGAQLFDPPENMLDQMCQDIALHHHDRWDGGETGYPGKVDLSKFSLKNGVVPESEPLSGADIPLAARIVAVADVFDALSHKRCYKESWSIEDSFAEIQNCAGKQFDPEVVLAFMEIKDRVCSIQLAYPDDPEE